MNFPNKKRVKIKLLIRLILNNLRVKLSPFTNPSTNLSPFSTKSQFAAVITRKSEKKSHLNN